MDPPAVGKINLRITSTLPADPICNIRFIMPGFEGTYATQVFHPDFLDTLKPFRALRFLNWMRTNDSPLSSWSQRTRKTSQTQGRDDYGVAPEYMIELANTLGTDVWITIPHLADDDTVTQLATLFRDGLDPTLRIFIEHSNEVWGIWTQGDWAEQQGLALGLATNPFTARIRFHSERSVSIFRLFKDVFGGTDRLVRVLGASHANSESITEVLSWKDAYQESDAVATAPYFGGRLGRVPEVTDTLQMDMVSLMSALDAESQSTDAATRANLTAIQAKGLSYLAYEGGQALYGQGGYENNDALTNLFISANRDPGMRPLYRDHFTRWKESGGGVFMATVYASTYTSAGSWGLLEEQQQDRNTAYKLLGLMDFLETYPQL